MGILVDEGLEPGGGGVWLWGRSGDWMLPDDFRFAKPKDDFRRELREVIREI